MVSISPDFAPVMIKGVRIHPEDPFRFDFYVDPGQSSLPPALQKTEIEKQIKYFMAGLTVPDEDLWVNLSPYEKNRVLPQPFSQTFLGRDLLGQDYLLKQLTASLVYPENALGRQFWAKIYAQARQKFGTTEVAVNTFNKVWIMPQTVEVYEHKDRAFVLASHLKVLLEEDYLSLQKHSGTVIPGSAPLIDALTEANMAHALAAQSARDIISPAVVKEVNTGRNFVQVRQAFSALILASWFKKRFKESFLGVNYVNQNKVSGVNVADGKITQKIYEQYLSAYKKGVYHFIKDDYDQLSKTMVPRKYFSGGVLAGIAIDRAMQVSEVLPDDGIRQIFPSARALVVDAGGSIAGPKSQADKALTVNLSIPEILKLNRLRFIDPHSGEENPDFYSRSLELEREFRSFEEALARAGIRPDGEPMSALDIERLQIQVSMKRAEIVRQMYEIGAKAMDVKDPHYLVALMAFKKVGQMQPLLKAVYANIVISSEFKPTHEVLETMLTPDSVINSKNRLAHDDEELQARYDAYVRTLDLIKNAGHLYIDALQRYVGDTDKNYGIGTVAVENIVYDLGLSDWVLSEGVTNAQGRLAEQKIEGIALALREMLFTDDPQVTDAMKGQAAEFLASLMDDHLRFGLSREKLDLNGGLAVPVEVYDMNLGRQNLDNLKRAQQRAFFTFWLNRNGHSLTAMDWLSNFYHKLSKQYYARYVGDGLKLETQRVRPELARATNRLAAMARQGASLEEMMAAYRQDYRQAENTYLSGAQTGLVVSVPTRNEDSAGGIGDSTFLSLYRPYLYRILNHAGLMTREDGTVDRNVEVSFEITDRKNLPKRKDSLGNEVQGEETFMSVQSLDMGWSEVITNARDALKKGKADLVLQTLVSLGLLPKPLMEKAIAEDKHGETITRVMQEVFDHVLGQGKGLAITMHVKGITAGSGLAVSSAIAMAAATAFDALTGNRVENPNQSLVQHVTKLMVKVDGPGYYYVEVAKDGHFDNPDETYRFPRREVQGHVSVDLILDQLPSGDGQYQYRVRKIQDDSTKVHPVHWDIKGEYHWIKSGELHLGNHQGPRRTRLAPGDSFDEFNRTYDMWDDELSIARAIIGSQTTVLRLAGKAGTQDELQGRGGMVLSIAGDPMQGYITDEETGEQRFVQFAGGVIPKMIRVPLSPYAMKRINQFMRIVRIGMVEPAEDTLDQVFTTSMLNASPDAQAAWAELTLVMMQAAQRGDIVAMGNAAYEMVALRQKIAPVSIHPVVVRVLEEFVRKYGETHHFRYGITGARSTGSVILFFDPQTPAEEIQRITHELANEIKNAREGMGKIKANEDDPHPFSHSRIAERGTTVLSMSAADMEEYREGVLKANAAFKEAERQSNNERMALYSPEELASLAVKYHLNDPKMVASPAEKDATQALTLEPELVAKAREIMARNPGQPFTEEDLRELRSFAQDNFRRNYLPFRSPGVNHLERAIVRARLSQNAKLLTEAHLSALQERVLLLAFSDGRVNQLWDFKSAQDIKDIVQALIQGQAVNSQAYAAEYEEFQGKVQAAQADFESSELDGTSHFSPAFRRDLEVEIIERQTGIHELTRKWEGESEQELTGSERNDYFQDQQELAHLRTMVALLSQMPSPEFFDYNHFIFTQSSTYRKYFGPQLRALQDAVRDGVYVYEPPFGGTGARAFGGAVKGVVRFTMGNESDMTFLRFIIRQWAAFLNKFPERRQAYINIMVSAFTEDAIKAALNDYIKETGLNPETVKVGSQSMREVVRPTELELMLQLAQQSTSTAAEYAELQRVYHWYIEKSQQELGKQKAEAGQEGQNVTRPVYKDEGVNPLNGFNPSGNAGFFEDMLGSRNYTLKGLQNMGYEINPVRLAQLESSPDGKDQLEHGMPLAVAALLVEGNGMGIAVVSTSSSLAQFGGGDANLAKATKEILDHPQERQPLCRHRWRRGGRGARRGVGQRVPLAIRARREARRRRDRRARHGRLDVDARCEDGDEPHFVLEAGDPIR